MQSLGPTFSPLSRGLYSRSFLSESAPLLLSGPAFRCPEDSCGPQHPETCCSGPALSHRAEALCHRTPALVPLFHVNLFSSGEVCSLSPQAPFVVRWPGADWKSLGAFELEEEPSVKTRKTPAARQQCQGRVGEWSTLVQGSLHPWSPLP